MLDRTYHQQQTKFYRATCSVHPVYAQVDSTNQRYIFNALDLSALPETNHVPGRTGHSKHGMLQALMIKDLEDTKLVPQQIEYLTLKDRYII